jgi:hypothetical protein
MCVDSSEVIVLALRTRGYAFAWFVFALLRFRCLWQVFGNDLRATVFCVGVVTYLEQ